MLSITVHVNFHMRRMARAEQISCNLIGQIDISTNKITNIGSRSTPL